MKDEEIIRELDAVEAELRSCETRLTRLRRALRRRIDPRSTRRDLGYYSEDDDGSLRPKPTGGSPDDSR